MIVLENVKTLPTKVYINPSDELQITRADLLVSNPLSLSVDVLNISEKNFIDLEIICKFKNEKGDYILGGNPIEYKVKDRLITASSMTCLDPFSLDFRFQDAREVEIRITKAIAEDGKTLIFNKEEQFIYSLPLIDLDKRKKMDEFFKDDIYTFADNFLDSWRCVCGCINDKDSETCKFCSRNKYLALNNLTQGLIDYKLAMANENPEDFKTKNIQILNTIKAPKLEDRKVVVRKNSKKNRLKTFFTVVIAILALVFIFLLLKNPIENFYVASRITRADRLLDKGELEKASDIFKHLKTKDPKKQEDIKRLKRLKESKSNYLKAEELFEENSLKGALIHYKKVIKEDPDLYEKAQSQIQEIQKKFFDKIKATYNAGHKAEAIKEAKDLIKFSPEYADMIILLEDMKRNSPEVKGPPVNFSEDKNKLNEFSNIRYTFQVLTKENSKLYESPSSTSRILKDLPSGTEVYIYETIIKNKNMYWLRVEAKEPESKDVFTGWIGADSLTSNE